MGEGEGGHKLGEKGGGTGKNRVLSLILEPCHLSKKGKQRTKVQGRERGGDNDHTPGEIRKKVQRGRQPDCDPLFKLALI